MPTVGNQWHFDPGTYLEAVRAEVPGYDELQATIADASADLDAATILDLGSGTGMTARAVLDRHPQGRLIGVDSSEPILAHARRLVPEATFVAQRLEDPLPPGPFDLVVSAFAVHHLDATGKAALFERVAAVLAPGGRFVLCDVVVPTEPVETPVPLDPELDQPSTLADQLTWLRDAGLSPTIRFARGDLAVISADRSR